ncbi:MAG: hypothetical protein CM15mP69_0590 [Ectothiorhodospiraceae bacterium]|nr:MAG: hypothetical protein CM15mP69_0590 [Ectothiorhodospiraceae bacterium]
MSSSNGYYVPHQTKWPFLTTVSVFILFIGAANFMNGTGGLYTVFLWTFALIYYGLCVVFQR